MTTMTLHGWVPDHSHDLGARLALVRQHEGWNIREAARECALDPASWGAWEQGRRPRDFAAVCQKISERAGCSVVWLMTGQSPAPAGGGVEWAPRGSNPATYGLRGSVGGGRMNNLEQLHAATEGLSLEQKRHVIDHLIGGASVHVPGDVWTRLIEAALDDVARYSDRVNGRVTGV